MAKSPKSSTNSKPWESKPGESSVGKVFSLESVGAGPSHEKAILYLLSAGMSVARTLGPNEALSAMMSAMANVAHTHDCNHEIFAANLHKYAEDSEEAWQIMDLAAAKPEGHG